MSPADIQKLEEIIATLQRIVEDSELSPDLKQQLRHTVVLAKRDLENYRKT